MSAASKIYVPEGIAFTAVTKGIRTSITYARGGKTAEDFSASDVDNIIELNGMKSELVICMLIPFNFGSYFVCMLLPIGYIMMTSGFRNESDEKYKVAADVGMAFATVYTVLIFLVYFAQATLVRLDSLDEQAMRMLDYSRGGLLFYYDLLGYGMMALSTFLLGLQ